MSLALSMCQCSYVAATSSKSAVLTVVEPLLPRLWVFARLAQRLQEVMIQYIGYFGNVRHVLLRSTHLAILPVIVHLFVDLEQWVKPLLSNNVIAFSVAL